MWDLVKQVAIRAAFKAVMDGKQVAMLAPTTILCQQHLNHFRDRMSDFPVIIEMMSRFRTSSQQRKIAQATADGSVDILIGTHRLLSADVSYKDLGLLIIDERQRFGVQHKEAIKAPCEYRCSYPKCYSDSTDTLFCNGRCRSQVLLRQLP